MTTPKFIAIDLETNGLYATQSSKIFCCAVNDGITIKVYEGHKNILKLKPILENPSIVKVAHHAQFDGFFLKQVLGITVKNMFCTKLIEQVLLGDNLPRSAKNETERIKYSSSLKYTLKRYGLVDEMDKSQAILFSTRNINAPLTKTEIEYAKGDVRYLLQLQALQEYRLNKLGLTRVANLENMVVEKVIAMRSLGIGFNKFRWMEIATHYELQRLELLKRMPLAVANWNSPKQIKEFFHKRGVPLNSLTDAEEVLKQTNDPILAKLIELRKYTTMVSKYGAAWLQDDVKGNTIENDNRIRADFEQILNTGRFSCIEESQKISFPGGNKPIKSIRVGQQVYCYGADGKPKIAKVLAKTYMGVKPLIKLTWQSSGTGKIGSLLCTPDHLIKTKNKGWVKAGELNRYDKLFHLRVADEKRPRVYGTNFFVDSEQAFIKKEYFNRSSKDHCHHKNSDTTNNKLQNLQVLTPAQHLKKHPRSKKTKSLAALKAVATKKKNGFVWVTKEKYLFTKYTFLKELLKNGGRVTYMPCDYGVTIKWLERLGIPKIILHKRWNNQRTFITRGTIIKSSLRDYTKLSIGWRLLKEHKLYRENHTVVSILPYSSGKVWDLTIERHENFIAEELCVHNCSHPNIQQLPRDTAHRSAFVPSKGNVFVIGDFAGQELGIMAAASKETLWITAMLRDEDVHSLTASLIYGIQWNEAIEKGCAFPKKCKCSKHLVMRHNAKTINFAIAYGAGTGRIASTLSMTEKDASKLLIKYKKVVPRLIRWLSKNGQDAVKTRVSFSADPYKRRRTLRDPEDWRLANIGKNNPVQSCGANMIKLAMVSTNLPIIMVIHDEIIVEVKKADAKKALNELKQVMEKAANYCTEVPGLIKVTPSIVSTLAKQ